MQTLQTTLLVLQVFVALGLIAIILVQHGKGADAGAAFGSGASSTVFGSRGSGNFLTRATTVLAVLFLVNSMTLGYIAAHKPENISLMEEHAQRAEQEQQQSETAPPVPADSAGEDDMPSIPGQ